MPPVPLYLDLAFIATTGYAVWCFTRAHEHPLRAGLFIGFALLATAALALTGFYADSTALPPRPVFLAGPSLLVIVCLFATPRGRRYIDGLRPASLTWLHTVRIPVELVLLALYLHGAVPRLMTFEGANPDILSGLSALPIFWFGYHKRRLPKWALIAWNLLGLALLANIVIRAVLAVPSTFQQLAFDQPNVAVLYFPYVWLPAVVVPLVLFAHLASLRHLIRGSSAPKNLSHC